MELPQGEAYQAEYIWIGGSGQDLRCKTRTITKKVKKAEDLPVWNFDGSSTGQAPGDDSEVMLKPRAIYPDPFRGGKNILVMCDCYKPDGTPIDGNTRVNAAAVSGWGRGPEDRMGSVGTVVVLLLVGSVPGLDSLPFPLQ